MGGRAPGIYDSWEGGAGAGRGISGAKIQELHVADRRHRGISATTEATSSTPLAGMAAHRQPEIISYRRSRDTSRRHRVDAACARQSGRDGVSRVSSRHRRSCSTLWPVADGTQQCRRISGPGPRPGPLRARKDGCAPSSPTAVRPRHGCATARHALLAPTPRNAGLLATLQRAERWVQTYTSRWPRGKVGHRKVGREIPADFGRK